MRFPRAFVQAMGLPLRFHWSAPLLVLIVVVSWIPRGPADLQTVVDIGAALFAIVVALLFHEWAHAAAAIQGGGRAVDVTVHGFGGAMRSAGVPRHKQGAMVAAGPVMNLTIGVVAACVATIELILAPRVPVLSQTAPAYKFAWQLMLINAYVGAFNLLPIVPLDGGVLSRLGNAARVARGSAWTMVALSAIALAAAIFLNGWLLPVAVVFASICAVLVGWRGVTGGTREETNEWGDVI